MLSIHPMVQLVPGSVGTATRGHNKLIAALLQNHGLQRCQYLAASPDFTLEFRSPFSAHCRAIRSLFEHHLLSTADSDLDVEHPDYTAQKRALEKRALEMPLHPAVYPPLATGNRASRASGTRLMIKSLKRTRSHSLWHADEIRD